MKTARELYPDALINCDWTDPYLETIYDYQPILDSFGKILVQVDDSGYDGDSRVFYQFEDRTFGVLQFGWGSCSGCDALQACHSYEEVDELIAHLESQIKRFPSIYSAQTEYFLYNRITEGLMYDISPRQFEFFEKCLKLIQEEL